MTMEPTMAFAVRDRTSPGVEVLVNFGVYAGRQATQAEIERLAEWLLDEVGAVSVVSEQRHQIGAGVEASVHQVRIEVAREQVPENPFERAAVERRVVERAEHWARQCVADRHVDVAEL
ncbi:MAG TPA: hypothetical protein VF186_09050 [Gaiellaceae bacterium]|jgi:hypothetical protein